MMLMKAKAINTKNAEYLILDTTNTPDADNRGFQFFTIWVVPPSVNEKAGWWDALPACNPGRMGF
jgi:hypothetical protein